MLFQAQRDFHLDLTKTLFVGDDERDQQAGVAAGCLTALVSEEHPLLDVVKQYLSQLDLNEEGAARP
jgi:D-glycero-D-manno-heptose 1,7-bisphosphate phosphatase